MSERAHPVTADELQAFANDSLGARRRGEVAAHVVGCQRCGADIAAWAVVRGAVRADVERDAGRDQRVLDAVLARLGEPTPAQQTPRDALIDAASRDVVALSARTRPGPASWLPRVAAVAALIAAVMVAVVLPVQRPAYAQLLVRAADRMQAAGRGAVHDGWHRGGVAGRLGAGPGGGSAARRLRHRRKRPDRHPRCAAGPLHRRRAGAARSRRC